MLVVPHLARLSRLCRGRPRPCSRGLPAGCALFVFLVKISNYLFVRPVLWEQKVAKKSESFVATFGRKLSSITLLVHARYGARKVLCTGLVECGGVLVQNSKVQVTPTRGQKSNTQPLSRTLNLARCTPRKAPSSSHQPVRHSIWRYPTKRLRCQWNPGGWSCVVSGRSYVIAGSFVVSGCCENVPPLC